MFANYDELKRIATNSGKCSRTETNTAPHIGYTFTGHKTGFLLLGFELLLIKLEFLREKYWIWDKRVAFDWSNRKRIQCMRDLYEHLTVDMSGSDKETGENR